MRAASVFLLRAACLLAAVPVFFCTAAGAAPPQTGAEEESPALYASSYIVMDADSGQVLIEKNADERRFPASVTKLMTLALAIEACGGDFSPAVTVSEAAIAAVGPDSTMIGLRPGEVLTVSDLLYATLLESANDAANVLGEYLAGDLAGFVAQMNERARTLGMTGTHFVNPSGYHDDRHYTTARDLALLSRWALSVPGFAEFIGTTEYTMPPTNLTAHSRRFITDNALLLPGAQHYEGIIGGKSGWTPEANYTMMEAARQESHTLVAIVLDCPARGERCAECARLLRYCAERFRLVELDTASLSLPTVDVWLNGVRLGAVQLEAAGSVFLPAAYGPDDFRVETQIPRWYMVSEPFEASASLVEVQTGKVLYTIAITPEPRQLADVLGVRPKPKKASDWTAQDGMTVFLGGVFIAVLAFLLSLNASFLEPLRRRSAKKSIVRLRAQFHRDKAPAEDAEDGPAP